MRVDADVTARAQTALDVLADLTPTAGRSDDQGIIPLDWFRWLDHGVHLLREQHLPLPDPGARGPSLFESWERSQSGEPPHPEVDLDRKYGERLAAIQQIRIGSSTVNVGWLWLAGSITSTDDAGERVTRRIFQPLVYRPVRVARRAGGLGWRLLAFADPLITPLVEDRATAAALETRIEYGGGAIARFNDLTPSLLGRLPRLTAFARDVAAAAGFRDLSLTVDRRHPRDLAAEPGLRIVVGLGVYAIDGPARTTRAGSLMAWGPEALREATAFHAIYAGLDLDPAETGWPQRSDRVESPLPLSTRQVDVVEHARHHALTVVAGGPGTGKSHTLVSVVCDALADGKSVLVAAKHEAAVDALVDLLDRQPGITPVVFGSNERRSTLAQRLSDGSFRPVSSGAVDEARRRLDAARAERDGTEAAFRACLRTAWAETPDGRAETNDARRVVPRLPAADELDELIAEATRPGTGWWSRRRRRRGEARLREATGSAAPLPELLAAIELIRPAPVDDRRPAEWAERLEAAATLVRTRFAEWLAAETRSPDRLDRSALAAVATLAAALRSGRGARRAQLDRLRDRSLTRALPVWIGTLGEVDDLLPAVPGLFDLVLVDEASATEQTMTAPALLRARRAVVVGDPRQLRHVSFLGDAVMNEVMDRHGVEPAHQAQLDVRRSSLFDAAAAVSPPLVLDEHFRSAPHLVDVVARTLYQGRLHVATRSPLTESLDCIHLEPVEDPLRAGRIVEAEVETVLTLLRRLRRTCRSVGVLTPFTAQAKRIEEAVLATFTADDLEHMDLRVGTVHAFQGNERDRVICSLGVVDDDPGGWRFVNDPHLLAVMLTRAREHMTVVTGAAPRPGSLLADYLDAADSPPGRPRPVRSPSRWAGRVIDDLRLAGVDIAESYPVGVHVVDAVGVERSRPIAIVCDIHSDGIDAHIARHMALHRQGWELVDALPTLWADEEATLIADLARRLQRAATDR